MASRFDSQVVLDDTGAQDLLGKGDVLFKRPGQGVQRVQGCMVAESEVLRVVEELKAQGAPEYVDAVTEPETGSAAGESGAPGARRSGENDPLYDEAVQMVIQHKRAATSFVQRRFNIGYNLKAWRQPVSSVSPILRASEKCSSRTIRRLCNDSTNGKCADLHYCRMFECIGLGCFRQGGVVGLC